MQKYIAKYKHKNLWYIEGPGRGESIDTFCMTKDEAQLISEYMNFAYMQGFNDYKYTLHDKLYELFMF